jgi:XRE family aerobic/anaerobic benzoate catabolism transcriptional regulator
MPEHLSSHRPEGQRLLRELGARLRSEREARGLSVSDLAVRAGLSRRYLTEAEAGRANLSLLRLLDLARALDLALDELVREAGPPPERIALVGLRGAGKSTLGRALALRLEAPFVELDQRVEALAGAPLGEVFALHGEAGYQRFEAEALEAVLREGGRLVLATGGSIVTRPETFGRLRRAFRTVWLRARPEDHFARVAAQGDHRPMADRPRARAELEAILRQREPLYAACDLTLDTSAQGVEASVAALAAALQRGAPDLP